MFVELIYDKRNFDGLPDAKDIILGELTKRVHRILPDADVRGKPMMTLLRSILTPESMRKTSYDQNRCNALCVPFLSHDLVNKNPQLSRLS